jgi:hypothetical protein
MKSGYKGRRVRWHKGRRTKIREARELAIKGQNYNK